MDDKEAATHEVNEAQMPRERLLKLGADALLDAELLALLLRTGTADRPVIPFSQDLLDEFGGWRGLLKANKEELLKVKGFGPSRVTLLLALLEITQRYLRESLVREDALTSPSLTRRYLRTQLVDYHHEVFACVFLDSQHRVIRYEPLFEGTIDAASVYPRRVVEKVIEYKASAVILAHNHPSGVAEPSDADRRITRRLQQALDLIDVRVLDHLVIGDPDVVSFAERNWL